jgi:hypothetical protein
VRAQVAGRGFDEDSGFSLRAAGRGSLRISPSLRPIARLDGGPVRILVRSGAPGTRRATVGTIRLRLRRVRVAPLGVLGLTARRDGDKVVVRWRSDRPAAGTEFSAFGLADRGRNAKPLSSEELGSSLSEKRQTSFSITLGDAKGVRWVALLTDTDVASRTRRWTVRVTG